MRTKWTFSVTGTEQDQSLRPSVTLGTSFALSRPAMCTARSTDTSLRGFTLIEMVIIVAIAGILVALATSSLDSWFVNQRLRDSGHTLASAFSYARGEAVRTGNMHVVFWDEDTLGNDLVANGETVPVLVLDDGRPRARPIRTARSTAASRFVAFASRRVLLSVRALPPPRSAPMVGTARFPMPRPSRTPPTTRPAGCCFGQRVRPWPSTRAVSPTRSAAALAAST